MADILAPITLIGLGRSGTTLLEKAFASVNNCYAGGETGGIIFGTYAGALHSFFDTKYADYSSREVFAASITRNLFLSLFPIEDSEYKYWFHKPAGIPKMIWWEKFVTEDDKNFFPTKWYWSTLDNIFPKAKYITVLRNPWEIIASRMVFSGWPEDEGWEDIMTIYDMLTFRSDSLEVIFFDDLSADPLNVISGLFRRLDLNIPARLSEIVNEQYVPTDKSELLLTLNNMDGPGHNDQLIEIVSKFWNKYGKVFDSPVGKIDFFNL